MLSGLVAMVKARDSTLALETYKATWRNTQLGGRLTDECHSLKKKQTSYSQSMNGKESEVEVEATVVEYKQKKNHFLAISLYT